MELRLAICVFPRTINRRYSAFYVSNVASITSRVGCTGEAAVRGGGGACFDLSVYPPIMGLALAWQSRT